MMVLQNERRRKQFGWATALVLVLGTALYFRAFESLARAAIPAAVMLVFALARRYLPAAASAVELDSFAPATRDSRFKYRQWFVGFGLILTGTGFAYLTHAALVAMNRSFAAAEGPAHFVLLPQTAIWWFFPGSGALALSWELTLQLWSLCGGREEATLYNAWSAQKSGFDCRKVLRLMAIFIVLPIGLLTLLAVPMHDTLHDDNIRVSGFAFRHRFVYRYSDARRMTTIQGFRTRDGKTFTRRAGIVIDFTDGRRWSSAESGDFEPVVNPELADFLEKKTGLPMDYAETELDIPRLAHGSH